MEENGDKGEIKKTKGKEKVAEKKAKKKKKKKSFVVCIWFHFQQPKCVFSS